MLTVMPTIDVEGVHGNDPFNQMVLGNIGEKQSWGIYKLAQIFSKYDVSATFFVDIYEYSMWGEDCLRDICCKLIDLGQDVQLHTHPGWREDPRDPQWLQSIRKKHSYMGSSKDLMAKLSLDEQVHVLEHGMEMLHKWIGYYPIAHRSGGYSINSDTLEALSRVGIPIDSSMYHGHPNSLETWTKNAIVERNGVIELPVTMACYIGSIECCNNKWTFYKRLMKTDLNVFDYEEFKNYSSSALNNNIKLLNIFMHSYSLMNYKGDFSRFWPNYSNASKLERTLEWLADKEDVQILNCTEFYNQYSVTPGLFKGSDVVPAIPLRYRKMLKYGLRRGMRYLKR
jgi:hypothetical protein